MHKNPFKRIVNTFVIQERLGKFWNGEIVDQKAETPLLQAMHNIS